MILSTVAAVGLLTGSAFAQNAAKPAGEGMQPPAAGGEAGEQKLPPGGAAPKGPAAGGQKMPGATGGTASPGMKPNPAAEPQPGQKQKGENAGVEPKPGQNGGQPAKAGAEGQTQPGQKAGEAPAAGQNKAGAAGKTGAARPAPKLTSAQSTEVKTAFRNVHVQPVHVDFRVGVGIAVPRTVVLEPVPREIVTIVPEYEGFRFFVVPGEIVIVDPETFEIVYILPI